MTPDAAAGTTPSPRRTAAIAAIAAAALWLALPGAALAHGAEHATAATAFTDWPLSAEIVIPTALLCLVYLRGIARRASVRERTPWWRHVALLAGVAMVFLAIQSPLDPIAERLFWVHQIQHLLLRMTGPMLIALAAPQATLAAGLPRAVRRAALVPVASSGPVRGALAALRHPAVVFGLFVGSLYFWEIPAVHDDALLDPFTHDVMHFTMMAAGLLFFFLVFDRRDPPKAVSHGTRILMLLGAIVSNIILGSVTTLKESVAYTAYDLQGRLFDVLPLDDEVTGGFMIWVPGSMMCVIAILIAIHRWSAHEQKTDDRRHAPTALTPQAPDFPATAEELRTTVAVANRRAGLIIAVLTATVFALAMTVVTMVHELS